MSSAIEAVPNSQARHKRTPSAILKSAVTTRSQKGTELNPSSPTKPTSPAKRSVETNRIQFQVPLGEISHNRERGRSAQRAGQGMETSGLRDKRTKSVISLKAITGRDKSKQPEGDTTQLEKTSRFKKSKSSVNLSAFLQKSKTAKNDEPRDQNVRNKENKPPVQTIVEEPPPIWAQFSKQQRTNDGQPTKVPLNDTFRAAEQAALYTPHEYSPSKGRTFLEQPSLRKPEQQRPSSKGGYFDGAANTQLTSAFSRLRKASSSSLKRENGRETLREASLQQSSSRPTTSDGGALAKEPSRVAMGTAKGGSRVKAAVAALSGKGTKIEPLAYAPAEQGLNKREVESAFEKMLESRNIAPDVREKMRALTTNMKADLIKKNSVSSPSLDGGQWPMSRQTSRPGTSGRTTTDTSFDQAEAADEGSASKKPRPRSLNFTLSKGDFSPSKKLKSGRGTSHTRHKSADLPRTNSSTSLNSIASSSSFKLFNRAPKQAVPDDFISYLRKVQKPQAIEVGKVQKLKQLLRNETVSWVDEFISDGGMIELINLLYRIIEIEWREEHEDNLLHHTLTCLKALTTTSSAMKQLEGLQSKLFPTLIALLFSSGDERKGPAEFPTRGLIISIIFAYLSASPTPSRAARILSYIRDPAPAETAQPLGFIVEMRRPRPYKLWCTEVANVAKEVFWIFLHSVNVIPYPDAPYANTHYCAAHFPAARPPVPAAPYVGSVEWDATTYLATHLDLFNGLIAAIPMLEERIALRTELRDSGFEKVMGGQLRLCKEKFYGHVHAGLITWAGAARADGWSSKDVREGPPKDEVKRRAKSSSPAKKKADKAPVLDMPKLDFGIGVGDRLGLEAGGGKGGKSCGEDDWL